MAAEQIPSDSPLLGLRVLVVDDGRAERELTCVALEMAGATVAYGCDGAEGLALACGDRYDAFVLDIEMPRLDGLELALRLRGLGFETPIFAVTSLKIGPDDPRRQKCNVSGWFEKPLNSALLVHALSLSDRYAIRPQVQWHHAPEPSPLPFDEERLRNATPRILAVVERFCDELSPMVEEIAASAAGGRLEELKARLHRMRGASGSCGFVALAAAVERWEDALDGASEATTEEGTGHLGEVRRAAETGRAQFLQFVAAKKKVELDA